MLCSSHERAVRKSERNSYVDANIPEEGGEEDYPGTRAEIPLQTLEKNIVRQVVSL